MPNWLAFLFASKRIGDALLAAIVLLLAFGLGLYDPEYGPNTLIEVRCFFAFVFGVIVYWLVLPFSRLIQWAVYKLLLRKYAPHPMSKIYGPN